MPAHIFWSSLAILHLAAWGFLAAAGWQLKRNWQDQPLDVPLASTGSKSAAVPLRGEISPARQVPKLQDDDPVTWLGTRALDSARTFGTVGIFLAAMAILLIGVGMPGHSGIGIMPFVILGVSQLLKVWFTFSAAHLLAATRREGALELLVCTPLTSTQIVKGFAQSLHHLAAQVLVCWWAALTLLSLVFVASADAGMLMATLCGTLLFQLLFLVDLRALGWLALWFGLTSKPHVAATRALFVVVVLPWLTLIIPCVGWLLLGLSPIWSLLLRRWAETTLLENFRDIVTDPGSIKGNTSWWRPIWDLLPPRPTSKPR